MTSVLVVRGAGRLDAFRAEVGVGRANRDLTQCEPERREGWADDVSEAVRRIVCGDPGVFWGPNNQWPDESAKKTCGGQLFPVIGGSTRWS